MNRLVALRHVPFWAQALALCALFAIAGFVALDDYGLSGDEVAQRKIATQTYDYALGISEEPPRRQNRYYGMTFEMSLLMAERALGLQDSRHIYLMRRILIHIFFIAGGFACGMLAYRMLGSRWIALLAMLLFLLHPRLYAHSFFNSKDIPFAVMLIMALYLTHRAFRRDAIGSFLLCGVGVGLAIDLRPFALMLPPIILAMRALDMWQAGRAERKRILIASAAFLATALGIAYIVHPYYWENPLRFIEGLRVMSRHPAFAPNLFMGEIYMSDAVPWNFIPVWFAITAPPATLLLGAIGCAAVCWQAITRPLAALRDRETRFRMLLLCCFALPVVAVVALQANIYHGWRQMYFLWAPFCLCAAVGLYAIVNNNVGRDKWEVAARLPGWIRSGRLTLALACGVAGFGLITTLTAMAALHPHQYLYFNALTDTKTPGALGERYDMDYLAVAQRQSLEHLLAHYPDGALRVWPANDLAQILPQESRDRLIGVTNPHDADFYTLFDARGHPRLRRNPQDMNFYIHPRVNLAAIPERQPLYALHAYGSVVASVVAKYSHADDYRAAYDDVAVNGTLLARSAFDVYAYDGALYYLSANCEPTMPNHAYFPIFLDIIPVDPADLPAARREHGFENRGFLLDKYAAFFDGKCIRRRPLPDYPIALIKTGQNVEPLGDDKWRADIDLAARAAASVVYDDIVAGDYGQPVAQSDFGVYLRGNGLAYLKQPCALGDADARFFLHIFPANPADLPADSRERGFANLDFQFGDYGAYVGDMCVAERELPAYPVERIRTGQFVSGEGRVWGAEFPVAR